MNRRTTEKGRLLPLDISRFVAANRDQFGFDQLRISTAMPESGYVAWCFTMSSLRGQVHGATPAPAATAFPFV